MLKTQAIDVFCKKFFETISRNEQKFFINLFLICSQSLKIFPSQLKYLERLNHLVIDGMGNQRKKFLRFALNLREVSESSLVLNEVIRLVHYLKS